MAKNYKKNIWHSGDIITTSKMNNIINMSSISNNIYRIPIEYDEQNGIYKINKTFNEIVNLMEKGLCYFIIQNIGENYEQYQFDCLIAIKKNNKAIVSGNNITFIENNGIMVQHTDNNNNDNGGNIK